MQQSLRRVIIFFAIIIFIIFFVNLFIVIRIQSTKKIYFIFEVWMKLSILSRHFKEVYVDDILSVL